MLPLEKEQCGESSANNDDQQSQGGDSLMKEIPRNGFNEDYGLESGSEELDLMVSHSELMLERD